MKEEIIGYAIRVIAIAKDNNETFAGKKSMDYVGRDYTWLTIGKFKPYKTKKHAEIAKKSWEKRLNDPVWGMYWTYIPDEVIPLTEQKIKQLEAEVESTHNYP